MAQILDCHSRADEPNARALSNFAARSFVLDGFKFASMEAFLQQLKIPNEYVQEKNYVCGLVGYKAWKKGQSYNEWKLSQFVYFNGRVIYRSSPQYQELLTRAYDAQYDQNPELATVLLSSVGKVLRHTMGKHDSNDTLLTESEYIRQLDRLRWRAIEASNDRD